MSKPLTPHINRSKVRRSFGSSVHTYDAHAVLQREIADRLLAHVQCAKIQPRRILDIGCGTGYFTRLLVQQFKKSSVIAVDLAETMVNHTRSHHPRRLPWHGKRLHCTADGCSLPFADASFDLVTSNLAIQWVDQPDIMMSEMRRVLAPGGLMLFSTFGRRTLMELRQSLAGISQAHAGLVLPFPDVMTLGDILHALPVEIPVVDADLFTLTYPDTMALVRELKGIGASSSAIRNRPGGLYGRKLLRDLDTAYASQHRMEDGKLRATFEALYAQAWYKEPTFQPAGEIIPIMPEA